MTSRAVEKWEKKFREEKKNGGEGEGESIWSGRSGENGKGDCWKCRNDAKRS